MPSSPSRGSATSCARRSRNRPWRASRPQRLTSCYGHDELGSRHARGDVGVSRVRAARSPAVQRKRKPRSKRRTAAPACGAATCAHEQKRRNRPMTDVDVPRAARQAPIEEGRRQRLDRLGARILRLLHLRDRRGAGLPADLLPLGEPAGRDHRLARHLRRRLRRPADRRLRPRPLGRHPRPQERADPLHVPDGLLDPRRRPPAHLRTRSASSRRRSSSSCASSRASPSPARSRAQAR